MVDVQTEILIDRPRETVAAYSGDPANAPQWYANISAAEWQTGASGFSKLLAPLVGVTMRAANTKDLKSLKRILESN